MTKEGWVEAAMDNDAMVVELLLRLKQSSSSQFYASMAAAKPLPPHGWGHRQPRSSRLLSVARKERGEPTRCSPTTPLSWSAGGGSASDGYDDSSRLSDRLWSGVYKGCFTNDVITPTTHKRSRKKKTFAELKEEETLLLNERMHLKRELASIRVTLKEQRVRSENLKRIKIDLNLQSANKTGTSYDESDTAGALPLPNNQFNNNMGASVLEDGRSILPRHDGMNNDDAAAAAAEEEEEDSSSSSSSSKAQKDTTDEMGERCFFLPDLNMMPSEEEALCCNNNKLMTETLFLHSF